MLTPGKFCTLLAGTISEFGAGMGYLSCLGSHSTGTSSSWGPAMKAKYSQGNFCYFFLSQIFPVELSSFQPPPPPPSSTLSPEG